MMSIISHAQNFEDVMLWRALRDISNGHYIDIGAQDPVQDSISLAFYERGWRGIHVEPSPVYAERLKLARPDEMVIAAAISSNKGPIQFSEFEGTGLSTGKIDIAQGHIDAGLACRKIEVPTVSLNEILGHYGEVHWMKVDVEGMEPDVLSSWESNPARPWIVVVEATAPNSQIRTDSEWTHELVERGYESVFFDGLSLYYVHESHRELVDSFRSPPNIFDRFQITTRHFSASAIVHQFQNVEAAINEKVKALEEEAQNSSALVKQLEKISAKHDRAIEQLKTLKLQLREAERSRNQGLLLERERAGAETARLEKRLAIVEAAREHILQELILSRDAAAQKLIAARDSATRRLLILQQKHEEVVQALWRDRTDEINRTAERYRKTVSALSQEIFETKLKLEFHAASCSEWKRRSDDLKEQLVQSQATLVRESKRHQEELDLAGARHARELNLKSFQLAELETAIENALARPSNWWTKLGRFLILANNDPVRSELENYQKRAKNTRHFLRESNMFDQLDHNYTPTDKTFGLGDVLLLWDADFVREAYILILNRLPEQVGERHYLRQIRTGRAKMDIIADLRNSPEARANGIELPEIDAAIRSWRLRRIPLMGRLFGDHSGLFAESGMTRFERAMLNQADLILSNSRQKSQLNPQAISPITSLPQDQHLAQSIDASEPPLTVEQLLLCADGDQ